jgi:hypothetical protein
LKFTINIIHLNFNFERSKVTSVNFTTFISCAIIQELLVFLLTYILVKNGEVFVGLKLPGRASQQSQLEVLASDRTNLPSNITCDSLQNTNFTINFGC